MSGHARRTSSILGRPPSIPASRRDRLRTVGPLTIAACPSAAKLPLTSSHQPGPTDAEPRTPKRHQRILRPPATTAAACLTATSSLKRSRARPTKRARGRTRPASPGTSTDQRERRPDTGRATTAAPTADFLTAIGDTLRSAPQRRRSSLPIYSKKEGSRRLSLLAPPLCSMWHRRGRNLTPLKGSRITRLCPPGGTRGPGKARLRAEIHSLPLCPRLRFRPTGKARSQSQPCRRPCRRSQKLWISWTQS